MDPRRRRRLHAVLGTMVLLAAAAGAAQLAGVTSRGGSSTEPRAASTSDARTYLVRGTSTGSAVRSLGRGGVKGVRTTDAGGGWTELRLTDDRPAGEIADALYEAGADEVEVVLPRLPYVAATGDPSAIEDPAAGDGSEEDVEPAPQEIDDPPVIADGSDGGGLRTGPAAAQHFDQQWALEQANDQDLDAPEAWSAGIGRSDVVVAVIDTGVDTSHPDLAGRTVAGRDFSGSGTGATTDRVGHGTMVASVIAGSGTGMAGIAPGVKIMPLKVFRDSAVAFSMAGYLNAIRWAADNGADVINISLGCGGTTSCWSDAEFDAIEYARAKGVLVVAAAGNGDHTGNGIDNDAQSTPDYPSGYELANIIAVTSSTKFGNWSTWSNYGRSKVDLAAPGELVLVAKTGGGWGTVSGTSFSAPYVAGIAALVESRSPGISIGDLRARILGSVVRTSTLATRTASGGIANADAAVRSTATGGGGSSPASTRFELVAPRSGVSLAAQPTLSWRLPAGWSSSRVLLRDSHGAHDTVVPPARRALLPPTSAWASGTYRWAVVARDARGQIRTSPTRTYVVRARHSSSVLGGSVTGDGRRFTARVRYRTNARAITTRVVILRGSRILHSGRAVLRRSHVASTRSPKASSFVVDARLSRAVRRGDRLVLAVTLSGGGASRTERWPLRIS